MKTKAQEKFDKIIKTCFHKQLKPLGFKKRNNNFYRNVGALGHIIRVQKSSFSTKHEISFTVNVGIFSPEYWLSEYNFKSKSEPPTYPTEPESIIRLRIGRFINGSDRWYDLDTSTKESSIMEELKITLEEKILPFFNRLTSNIELMSYLENEYESYNVDYIKFVMYGEFGMRGKLEEIYPIVLSKSNKFQIERIKVRGSKYGLQK